MGEWVLVPTISESRVTSDVHVGNLMLFATKGR